MAQLDSTETTELIPIQSDLLQMELWMIGGSGFRRIPFVESRMTFSTSGSKAESWTVSLGDDGEVKYIKPEREVVRARLGQEVELNGESVRVVDLRLLPRFSLVSLGPEEGFRIWSLADGSHHVGRPGKRFNQISLTEPTCSRTQATITVEGEKATLTAETGMTALDSRELESQRPVRLSPGALVQFGAALFRWEFHQPRRVEYGSFDVFLLGRSEIVSAGKTLVGSRKSLNLFHWLVASSPGALPVATVLEEYWPGRSTLRQRKNLSHLLLALKTELDLGDEGFERAILRDQESLRLGPDVVASCDLWTLQQKIRGRLAGEVGAVDLLDAYPGHLLPARGERWVKIRRREVLKAWLEALTSGPLEPAARLVVKAGLESLRKEPEQDASLLMPLECSLRNLEN